MKRGFHICQTCGAEFHRYGRVAKYCSWSCSAKSEFNRTRLAVWSRRPRPWQRKEKKAERVRHLVCAGCGVNFTSSGQRKYCPACSPLGKRIISACTVCGCEKRDSKKTCSRACENRLKSIRQQGEASHRWRGGKTNPDRLERNTSAYAEWRNAVFMRDDFTCKMCGARGGKLAAHHIRKFKDHPELRLDVSNGVTLCWPCHRSIRWKEEKYVEVFSAVVRTPEEAQMAIISGEPSKC